MDGVPEGAHPGGCNVKQLASPGLRSGTAGFSVNGHVSGHWTSQGVTVLSLSGDHDVATVDDLRGWLVPAPSATGPDLAVDLRDVGFIDCAVVGALVAARNLAVGSGGCVRLASLRAVPRRVLALCALADVFCVYDALDEAAAAVCARHQPSRLPSPVPAQRTGRTHDTGERLGQGGLENPTIP
jgi:anti-sigma B factor antagonist